MAEEDQASTSVMVTKRIWVLLMPLHCDIKRNEKAGELATDGAKKNPAVPVGQNITKTTIKERCERSTTKDKNRYLSSKSKEV